MATDSEIIALVLGESYRHGTKPGEALRGAQRLMRDRDGRVSLEDVQSQEEFDRTARTTGCFRRGKVIRDPDTREIIGYELEEVSLVEASSPALA